MKKKNMTRIFVIWIIILVVELFYFKQRIFGFLDKDELYFHLSLIFSTLVVGAIGLVISNLNDKR